MRIEIAGREVFCGTGGHAHVAGQPWVVMLHGAGLNHTVWASQSRWLAFRRRNVLAVDLPGHGHSDWRDDGAYSPSNLADDISAALGQLAPSARMVVGMSLGGLTSMELAVRHPHLVRRLMMVDIGRKD